MNRSLFLSRHAAIFVAVVGSFVAYVVLTGHELGRVTGKPLFQVVSGWATLAMMLAVMGYVLRKYSHKGRYSPEFRMKVDLATLERGDAAIAALRTRTAAMSKRDIEREAKRLLKETGVWKVNRVRVEKAPLGTGWNVQIVPREPLGRVAKWMHAHIYYGLSFATILWLHAGNPFGSSMGSLLAGLGYVTFISGVVGVFLWSTGPSRLTKAEFDLSVEEAFGLRETLEGKRITALKEFEGGDPGVRAGLQKVVDAKKGARGVAERTLGDLRARAPDRADEIRDAVTLILLEHRVRDELTKLLRVRMSFMSWRLLHVPVAAVLCGIVALHVLSVWRY